MLNVDRLAALHAVASQGSIQAAAEALHVTTSAVSQQIAKLERETDQLLLERVGRGVRLTDAGALLVAHTREVISLLERAEADLEAHRDTVSGHIVMAAFPTAARGLAPRALALLRDEHPQLRVELRELEPLDAVPQLMRRELDLVIAQDWFNNPLALPDGLEKEALFDDLADVAVPARHRLARRATIKLEDLADEQWITWPVRSICHDWLLHTLRSAGHEPRITHTAAEHDTQLALVAAGLGMAIIPRLGRGTVPEGVKMIAATPILHRKVHVIWRSDAARRAAIRVAIDGLQCAVKAMGRRRGRN
ncbi:MAG TPA: LysR substrate-binding domain-containing protein [Thermoanaerobaculia bacterium]